MPPKLREWVDLVDYRMNLDILEFLIHLLEDATRSRHDSANSGLLVQ